MSVNVTAGTAAHVEFIPGNHLNAVKRVAAQVEGDMRWRTGPGVPAGSC